MTFVAQLRFMKRLSVFVMPRALVYKLPLEIGATSANENREPLNGTATCQFSCKLTRAASIEPYVRRARPTLIPHSLQPCLWPGSE